MSNKNITLDLETLRQLLIQPYKEKIAELEEKNQELEKELFKMKYEKDPFSIL